MKLDEFSSAPVIDRYELSTAAVWGADMALGKQYEVFDTYAANLWRAETGLAAAVMRDGELVTACPNKVFAQVLEAFRVALGMAMVPEEERDDEAILKIGLADVTREGISELWREADMKVRHIAWRQPKYIRSRVDVVICQFEMRPTKGARRQLRLMEYHIWLANSERRSDADA